MCVSNRRGVGNVVKLEAPGKRVTVKSINMVN